MTRLTTDPFSPEVRTRAASKGPSSITVAAHQFAALEWVDGRAHHRPHYPINNIPPAEDEERYQAELEAQTKAARSNPMSLPQTRADSIDA